MGLCWCGEAEAVYTDRISLRSYCRECAKSDKTSPPNVHLQYIESLIPLAKGDVVDCFQAGDRDRYDGSGIILEVSTSIDDLATPAHPVYTVRLKGGKVKKYTNVCLKRVH